MDKLVEHLFVFEGDGVIRDYPGNYSDYREWSKKQQAERDLRNAEAKRQAKKEKGLEVKEVSNVRKLSYEERKEFRRLEKEIEKLEKKKLELSNKFSDTSLSGEDFANLSKELGQIDKDIEEKEDRWLELSEWV